MVTSLGGTRYATSVGGTLTGLGGNFIIIDDPIKADGVTSEAERRRVNDYYDSTLYSRLNNKSEDVIILIMQRLHVDDLVGHVRDKEDWVVLDIPAIATEPRSYELGPDEVYQRETGEVLHEARENRDTLEATRNTSGSHIFEAQHQQCPSPLGGNLVKREWLRRYRAPLPLNEYSVIVQSWDTASSISETADYSVGITFGVKDGTAHMLDVVRRRLEFPDLCRLVEARAEQFQVDDLLIERANSGIQLQQNLRREGYLLPISPLPRGDKISRLEGQLGKIEAGYLLIPETADWLDDFETELLSFPRGRHDDQVDALTQFLEWFSRHRGILNRPARREKRDSERRQRPAGRSHLRSSIGQLRSNGRLLVDDRGDVLY